MNQGLPTALILGIDHFVAKKLAEELVNKDIKVVGVGEMVVGLEDLKNFDWVMDLDEVTDEFNYVFDFTGRKEDWKKIKGEKFTLVTVDDDSRRNYLSREVVVLNNDWRIVEAKGVYGERMDEDSFWAKIIKQAVSNQNLELPEPNKIIRLLAVTDLVEAILRASFLSGTNREYFLVLGVEITCEELAKVLMDKAKMTRFKVIEIDKEIDQGNERLAETTESQLRWKAQLSFDEEVDGTLQYFFSLKDEENRKKRNVVVKKNEEKKDTINHKRIYDVLIDEGVEEDVDIFVEDQIAEENDDEVKIVDYNDDKEEKEVEFEENFELPSLIEVDKREDKEDESVLIEEDEEDEVRDEKKDLIEKTEIVPKKSWFKKYWWVGLLVLLFGSLIKPVSWYWTTTKTIKDIKNIPMMVKDKKYNQVEILAEKRINGLNKIDEQISELGLNSFVLGRNYQSGLKILIDFLVLEKGLPKTARAADNVSEAIFKEKQIDWNSEIETLKNGIGDVEVNVGLLQARLSGDYSWLPAKWRSTLQKEGDTLNEIRGKINLGKEAIGLLPEFFGLDGKRREYMVLFQNESELRPTGGFIGSYGLVSFQGGKLIDFKVKDVYEADGQLKGHVEPPWEIKTYLNEANWYMRDANWKADFMQSSADIQWFLEKEVNQKVDGVIGVDLAVAKSILGVIGEVYVPDFNEKISQENLYEQAEFYAETKFFPGSVQKASFLGGLGKQMFEEIKNLKTDKMLLLVDSILDLLESNEIQIAANNSDLAKKINNLGWDGKIYNGKCTQENCLADYWYVVEANLGVNKANYFVSRGVEEVTEISDTNLNRTIKINYENTAKNSNWPGGDYKNYVRIYLPKNVELSQISVADGYDTSIKKIYSSNEINIKEVDGKKEIGFLVTVPVLKKRILEIKYSSLLNLGNSKEFTYMKYIQRQPGIGDVPLVSLVSFPDSWQPLQVEPVASMVGGKLLFNMKLDGDIKMGVVLGK